MLSVIATEDAFEIRSIMPWGQRVLLALCSLVPLLAPLELLLRPRWTGYGNLLFLVSAVIALGALALSAFLLFAAVAGLNARLRFDRVAAAFTYTVRAPIVKPRTLRGRIGDIAELRVEKHDWSEGAPSWSIVAVTREGRELKAGSSWSLEDVEGIIRNASLFLRLPPRT